MQSVGTFYLIEDVPKFTKYMSEPIKMVPGTSPLDTPGYFLAGILKGYLASAGFAAECALATHCFYWCLRHVHIEVQLACTDRTILRMCSLRQVF